MEKPQKSSTGVKHQLIIAEHANYPVRSEAGQHKSVYTLVVNWKGTWAPGDNPEKALIVAPGDELEIVLDTEKHPGCSLWLFKQELPLLMPSHEITSQESTERVDLESGSKVFQVNHALAGASGESRYGLRVSALGEYPMPIVGQGNPGTLTASKP